MEFNLGHLLLLTEASINLAVLKSKNRKFKVSKKNCSGTLLIDQEVIVLFEVQEPGKPYKTEIEIDIPVDDIGPEILRIKLENEEPF